MLKQMRVAKLILLGTGAVGKTSLRRKYLGEGFSSEYLMTIGADFAYTAIQLPSGVLKSQIWDIAGQPRFSVVRKTYYSGCVGGIIVFDRTRPDTLDSAMKWLEELWKNCGHGPIPVIILGNKSDLLQEEYLPIDNKAESWSKEISEKTLTSEGFRVSFLKTSAKTGLNVNIAFELIAKEVFNYIQDREPDLD
ncbi:MAG: Rab family GTPase [Candidatus Hermodarchaeota archaeon]